MTTSGTLSLTAGPLDFAVSISSLPITIKGPIFRTSKSPSLTATVTAPFRASDTWLLRCTGKDDGSELGAPKISLSDDEQPSELHAEVTWIEENGSKTLQLHGGFTRAIDGKLSLAIQLPVTSSTGQESKVLLQLTLASTVIPTQFHLAELEGPPLLRKPMPSPPPKPPRQLKQSKRQASREAVEEDLARAPSLSPISEHTEPPSEPPETFPVPSSARVKRRASTVLDLLDSQTPSSKRARQQSHTAPPEHASDYVVYRSEPQQPQGFAAPEAVNPGEAERLRALVMANEDMEAELHGLKRREEHYQYTSSVLLNRLPLSAVVNHLQRELCRTRMSPEHRVETAVAKQQAEREAVTNQHMEIDLELQDVVMLVMKGVERGQQ